MFPVLFDGDVAGIHVVLQTYTTMLVVGLIAGVALALALSRAKGLPVGRSAIVFIAAVASVPFGARLLHVVTFIPLFRDEPAAAVDTGLTGLALFGGLTSAVVVAVIVTCVLRLDLWKLADAAAPGIVLGIAFAKLGCFGAGCCHGVVASGPFSVVFGLGSPAHGLQLVAGVAGPLGPVQPVLAVQLMEVAAALAVGAAALVVGRLAPSGVAFLLTAAGFSAARFALNPLRWVEVGFAAPSWTYPAVYVAIISACFVLGVWRVRAVDRAVAIGPEAAQEPQSVLDYARSRPSRAT